MGTTENRLSFRKKQIENLVDYLTNSANIDLLLSYFKEGQLNYFESLSEEDLKESYIDCFGNEEE
jgi:hypothetical protein